MMSRSNRIVLSLCLASAFATPTLAAKRDGKVQFVMQKGRTWKQTVWGMPVAARSTVEKAMLADLRERYGNADIRVELSQPSGMNIAFDGPKATTIPQVFASVNVNGASKHEIYADARRGKVSVFTDKDDLRPKYGLRPMSERLAEMRAYDKAHTRPLLLSPELNLGALDMPAVFMSRVGVNNQFPAMSLPGWFAANPFVQAAAFWSGAVRVK